MDQWGTRIGADPNQAFTADFIDSDGDGVDDRWQTGPGTPNQGPGQGLKTAGVIGGMNQPVGQGQIAPSALTPGSALAMSPITQQLQFQQPNANWQQWNQNLRRFS
jgi:hypothetical protein